MNEVLQRAVEIAKELERRKATNRMVDYEPYKYQKKFHNNKSNDKPKPASEKQLYLIKLKCEQNGINPSQYLEEELTMQQAREIIEQLKGE